MRKNIFENKRKEEDIIYLNEEKSTNIQSYFYEPELSRNADEDSILDFIKIIERDQNQNLSENIYETQNSIYVCGYSNNSLAIFDNKFSKIIQIKDLNDLCI